MAAPTILRIIHWAEEDAIAIKSRTFSLIIPLARKRSSFIKLLQNKYQQSEMKYSTGRSITVSETIMSRIEPDDDLPIELYDDIEDDEIDPDEIYFPDDPYASYDYDYWDEEEYEFYNENDDSWS